MQKLTTLFIAISIYTTCISQNAKLTGVVSGANGIALSDVSIMLQPGDLGTTTDTKGMYMLELPEGIYTVQFSCIGYQHSETVVQVLQNRELEFNIRLVEAITDLPEIVINSRSITGGDAGIRDIPGSAFYISPKQMQKFNYSDVHRTLRVVPGVNIQEEDGFGLRPNIGLRGTGVDRSSKITLMEDGVLIAPAPYSAPSAYYFPTVGRMQSVEILKGSSQIKYGPYTTGGAINFISTQIPDNISGHINLNYGSFNTQILHATVGESWDQVGFVAETFQYGSDGFKQLDNGANTGFDKEDYLIKLKLNTGSQAKVYQSIQFKTGYVLENSNETYLGLTAEDFDETPYRRYAASQKDNMQNDHLQLSATHTAQFSPNANLTTVVYRNTFNRNWYKLDKVSDSTGQAYSIADILDDPETYASAYVVIAGNQNSGADALQVKANNRSYYAQGIESIFSYQLFGNAIHQFIQLGARFHQDEMDRFQWTDKYAITGGTMMQTSAGVPGTESNYIVDANAFAAYLTYKLDYKKWSVTPGVRFENILMSKKDYGKTDPERTGDNLEEEQNNFNVFIPGIGLQYNANDALQLFMGAHKGFAPAGPADGAAPEESINYELGSRYYKSAVQAQAIIFYTDYSNLLGADLAASGGSGTSELYNGGAATAYGIELLFSTNTLQKVSSKFALPITISYTYTDAYFNSTFDSEFEDWGQVQNGDELPYLAHNQFFVQLSLEHEKFAVNASTKYVSDMRAQAGQGAIPQNELIAAHAVLDFSAAWNVNSFISICGSITNLTDNVYVAAIRPAGYRPGMPRSFNIGIKTYLR